MTAENASSLGRYAEPFAQGLQEVDGHLGHIFDPSAPHGVEDSTLAHLRARVRETYAQGGEKIAETLKNLEAGQHVELRFFQDAHWKAVYKEAMSALAARFNILDIKGAKGDNPISTPEEIGELFRRQLVILESQDPRLTLLNSKTLQAEGLQASWLGLEGRCISPDRVALIEKMRTDTLTPEDWASLTKEAIMASMRPAADVRRDPTLLMLSFLTPPQMQKFANILVAEGDPETLDVLLAMVALGSMDRTVADEALSTHIKAMKGKPKEEKRLREAYARLHGESMDQMIERSEKFHDEVQDMLERRWGSSNIAKKMLTAEGVFTMLAGAWGATEVLVNMLVNYNDPLGSLKNPMVLAGAGVAGAALWKTDNETGAIPFAPNRIVAAALTDQPEREEEKELQRHKEPVRAAMNANPIIAKLYYENLPAFLLQFQSERAGEAVPVRAADKIEMPQDLKGLITQAEFKTELEEFSKDMDALTLALYDDAGKRTVRDQAALMNEIRKDMGLEPYPPLEIPDSYTS